MKLRRRRQQGATTVEYAVLVSVMVVGLIPAVNVLSGAASASFDEQSVAMTGTPSVSAETASAPTTTTTSTTTTSTTTTTLANVPPTASFTASCTDLACTFTDTSSDTDGTIVGWQWSYGDAGAATTQHGERTYSAGGTYEVTLQVTDEDGATSSWSRDVTPTDPPVADVGLVATAHKDANLWIATFAVAVAVTDASQPAAAPLAGVVVVGEISKVDDGGTVAKEPVTCTTGLDGACAVTVRDLPKTTQSVTFTVTEVVHGGWLATDRPSATSTNPTRPEGPGDKPGKK